MIALTPLSDDPRPWPERFTTAVTHPVQWVRDLTGTGRPWRC